MVANVPVDSKTHFNDSGSVNFQNLVLHFSPILLSRNEQIAVELRIALSFGVYAPRNPEDVRTGRTS